MNSLFHRVQQLDTLAFVWVHVTKKFGYRKSISWLSHTGDGYLYIIAAAVLVASQADMAYAFVGAGLLAYTLEVSLYLVLKNTIKRDRPAVKITHFKCLITPSDQFSFPSGHTAAAFLFACLVALFYPAYALPCYVWAGAVGASRVLLGVHYPSDIVAGAVLGTGCALVGFSIYNSAGFS